MKGEVRPFCIGERGSAEDIYSRSADHAPGESPWSCQKGGEVSERSQYFFVLARKTHMRLAAYCGPAEKPEAGVIEECQGRGT